MKTLFIARLPFTLTESDLRAEFGKHGPLRSVTLVRDKEGKSKGYAFVEYEHTGDMKLAYKAYPPDGFVRLGGSDRWSLVDVERGRTVPDWCVLFIRQLQYLRPSCPSRWSLVDDERGRPVPGWCVRLTRLLRLAPCFTAMLVRCSRRP
jgi:RNA recognition motif-containing protein